MSFVITKVFLVAALIFGVFYTGCRAERGQWDKRLTEAQAVILARDSMLVQLRIDSAGLETKLREKITVSIKWKDRWHTVATDTQWVKGDSVPYPVYRKVIVTADSTITACTETVTACMAKLANAEQRASGFAKNAADLRLLLSKPKPLITPERIGLTAMTALFILKLIKVF